MPLVCLGPADLGDGASRAYDVGERLVLVSRRGERWFAISDWCNHAGCQLSQGDIERDSVTCPCHGARFDLRTGKNENAPELCGDQDAYEVTVEGGKLFLALGD